MNKNRSEESNATRADYDREQGGKIAYEAYRASLNRTTDDTLPKWEWADHETQLAFRDVSEAVARTLLPNDKFRDTAGTKSNNNLTL